MVHFMPTDTTTHNSMEHAPRIPPYVMTLLVVLVYQLIWIALDAVAFRFEIAPEIKVWSPPSALNLVLLLIFGVRYWPALLFNAFLHDWLVTQRSLPITTLLIFDFVTVAGYVSASFLLLHIVRINPRLRSLRDVGWFILAGGLLAPLCIAAVRAATLAWTDIIPWTDWFDYTLNEWAGQATGIAMLAPVLLIVFRRWPRLWQQPDESLPMPLRQDLRPSRRSAARMLAEGVGLGGGIWAAYGIPRDLSLDYTYFIFAPLIWFAVRYGFTGAVMAVLTINLGVASLVFAQFGVARLLTLQFGLMAISYIGILLGAFITERRRQTDQRMIIESQLQETQAFENMGRLASGVAHDFNNLLTAIRGHTELALLDLPPDSEAHHSVAQVQHTARRASELVRQLLVYSGKGHTTPQEVDINAIIADTAALLTSSLPVQVTLRLDFDAALPAVEADPTQLGQVFMNLILNAAEAIGDAAGSIVVTTDVYSDGDEAILPVSVLPPGQYIRVEVTDSGAGMSPETQARMFEPFFTTKQRGHGLGLALVFGIVRSHGGHISVSSTPAVGTTFTLFLPC